MEENTKQNVCWVGDVFEHPETDERIVILEKGKGYSQDRTYVRVLSYTPDVKGDGFHFTCNDRYMDAILEHWYFVGRVYMPKIMGDGIDKSQPESWGGQAMYDARKNVHDADDVNYLVKRSMHNATSINGMWTINYISALLHLVYGSGMKYDIEHLFLDIVDYARSACYPEDMTRALKIISQMPFASKYISCGERFGQPRFRSIYEAAKLMNAAKTYIMMNGRFMVKDLIDLTEVRTSAFAQPAEYVYGWDQYSLFDDTLIYEDPDESGVIRICIPAPRRLKATVTKDDLVQAEEVSEAFEKCVTAMEGKEKDERKRI